MSRKTPLQEMEQNAKELIRLEQNEQAVKALYELVIAYAKAKDFGKANAWREKMIELDPMALTEIVNSAEVIDAEMAEGIDDTHKKTWENLYEALSREEGNAFYFNLKQLELAPGKIIIQQGSLNHKLFLIDQGQLKIFHGQGDKEFFLKELQTGETAGQDTFFPISICTTTVMTVSAVKLRCLDRSDMQKIEEDFTGFEQRLLDYCSGAEEKSAEEILKDKEMERRQLERFKVSGKTTTQIIDKKGAAMGKPFNGVLDDVSVGGACFFIKCSQRKTARMLLGRTATLAIEFKKDQRAAFSGNIVGVEFHLFSDYALHFRFSKPYREEDLRNLISY